jgi:hypothetical protein
MDPHSLQISMVGTKSSQRCVFPSAVVMAPNGRFTLSFVFQNHRPHGQLSIASHKLGTNLIAIQTVLKNGE